MPTLMWGLPYGESPTRREAIVTQALINLAMAHDDHPYKVPGDPTSGHKATAELPYAVGDRAFCLLRS